MGEKKLSTVSDAIDTDEKHGVDLDHALAVAGFGQYNIKYCIVLCLILIGAILEPIGNAYILPAARCDLEMSDQVRGFAASVPYIGSVLTSFPLGYLVDTRGRKWTVIYTSLAAGTFGILSAFMPDMISFIIFKFLTSLCLACPAAVPYTFIGEISPLKYRDLMLTIITATQIAGTILVPLFAWAILPLDFEVNFGAYYFRSWRLLTIVNASVFVIAALLLLRGPESPKFLVSQGRHEESLEVLKTMYAGNKRKSPDDYPIKSVKYEGIRRETNISFLKSLKAQSVPLFRPPYLKWMVLNSTLMFGLFATLNGLNMWYPDIVSRVLSDDIGGTGCEIISRGSNETSEPLEGTECVDTFDETTFLINTVGNTFGTFIAIIASVTIKYTGKKLLLILVFTLIGAFFVIINFVTVKILFAILFSTIVLLIIAIGPINAYAVEIFPTHLRGMAIGLSMMMGRVGSVLGSNIAGLLLNSVCELTFYLFGGSLIVCGLLCFLMPKSKSEITNRSKLQNDSKL